ncbi:GNAT family N-acetyltransferase [Chitinimonas sp.]|uniref:GNAT family N-acetyltransferase n=1 Tax=Chitinimonas sp. TaxID=1934313 RepID=UPI0035AE9B1B
MDEQTALASFSADSHSAGDSGLVRHAIGADLDGILALYRELRPHDPVLAPEAAAQLFADLLGHPSMHLLVCEIDGLLVATCCLAVLPNLASGGRSYGLIEHVVTLASHRGQGHARRVMAHALTLACSLGCYKVMLLSGAQRSEAHRLYASLGFDGDAERGFVAKPCA